jgi:hypothetical protein
MQVGLTGHHTKAYQAMISPLAKRGSSGGRDLKGKRMLPEDVALLRGRKALARDRPSPIFVKKDFIDPFKDFVNT